MQKEIQSHDSMAAFYASLGGTLEQAADFTIHRMEAIHAEAPFASPLFRANYYSLVLIRRGAGRYLIDDQAYPTQDGTLYFTNPGHVKGFELHRPCEGYVITFSEAFLKQQTHAAIFDDFPFLIAEVAPPYYPGPEAFAPFGALAEQILREYEGDSAYKLKVIGSLLIVFLLRFKEAFWQHYDPAAEADSGSLIVRTFRRNLEGHMRDLAAGEADELYQVQDFADAQGLHPSYLSTVIKRKTGRSVSEWIAEKVVAEAQALLARSGVPVKEIAYRLAFKEPGHFSRFFKKQTGLTPSGFRRELQARR